MRPSREILEKLQEIQEKINQVENPKIRKVLENEIMELVMEFKTVIVELQKWTPFYGRILTQGKYYAGLVKKLEMNGKRELGFELDCFPKRRIPLERIEDIQPWKDQNGKPIFWEDIRGKNGEE